MAHIVIQLVARLLIYSSRWKPTWLSQDAIQPDGHNAARGIMAWAIMAVCIVGHDTWLVPGFRTHTEEDLQRNESYQQQVGKTVPDFYNLFTSEYYLGFLQISRFNFSYQYIYCYV